MSIPVSPYFPLFFFLFLVMCVRNLDSLTWWCPSSSIHQTALSPFFWRHLLRGSFFHAQSSPSIFSIFGPNFRSLRFFGSFHFGLPVLNPLFLSFFILLPLPSIFFYFFFLFSFLCCERYLNRQIIKADVCVCVFDFNNKNQGITVEWTANKNPCFARI